VRSVDQCSRFVLRLHLTPGRQLVEGITVRTHSDLRDDHTEDQGATSGFNYADQVGQVRIISPRVVSKWIIHSPASLRSGTVHSAVDLIPPKSCRGKRQEEYRIDGGPIVLPPLRHSSGLVCRSSALSGLDA